MSRKKKEVTKPQEIPKRVDDKKNKPKPIQWKELDKYIGQPIWDNREKKWRILDGYRRSGNTFAITFSDIVDWVSFNDRYLYLEEVKD